MILQHFHRSSDRDRDRDRVNEFVNVIESKLFHTGLVYIGVSLWCLGQTCSIDPFDPASNCSRL